VDEEMRERIGKIATDAAAAVGYRSAGTVEGLQEGEDYFFLEMNTRVQVEHCVTEMVTGIDIVREQVLVAAGEELSVKQDDLELRGHAIECRINAEAAHKNFAPAPGTITSYVEPAGPGVRVDSGVRAGSEVTPLYDPMIAKLIAWDTDRERATARMLRALGEYEIGGIVTLIPFHEAILATDQWQNAETARDLIGDKKWLKSLESEPDASSAPPPRSSGSDEGRDSEPAEERTYQIEVDGRLHTVKVIGAAPAPAANPGTAAGLARPPRRERGAGPGGGGGATEVLVSPIQGTVLKVPVSEGDEVAEGALICVVEAMKMENEIAAHRAGKVTELSVAEGGSVAAGDPVAKIE
jgi:acetyl-CoA/propionyl-CoA carboxylase biotin carboxyl carrier protein